jgi:hypothetical protein
VLEKKRNNRLDLDTKKLKLESPFKNISTMDRIGCPYNLQFVADPTIVTHAYVLHLLI